MNAKDQWVLKLVEEELSPTNKIDTEMTTEPKSQVQGILKAIYNRLRDTSTPDEFDGFYQGQLKDYKQKVRVFKVLDKYCEYLCIAPNLNDYNNEREVEMYLSTITETTLEEPDTLDGLKTILNEKYPGLVCDVPDASEDGIKYRAENYKKNLIRGIREKLDNGLSIADCNVAEYLAKITGTKGKVEKIATKLNKQIIIGKNVWEIMLYAVLSAYAPPFEIEGLHKRPNIHTMMCGDISTAKSEVLSILENIAPRQYRMDDSTQASFEGASKADGTFAPGIVDIANNGVLLVHEFDKILRNFKTMRRYMDCQKFKIHKRGASKEVDVNITYIVASNPESDFFKEEVFRKQIKFTEGMLSRFDALIPLTATPKKNSIVLQEIALFGGQKYDYATFKETLKTIATGLVSVTAVRITENQEALLKEIFEAHNIELADRPLVLLRDVEILCRLVNVIVCTNILDRKIDGGTVYAEDTDILKAISLWEDLIHFRKVLYQKQTSREIFRIKDHILKAVAMHNMPTTNDLKRIVVDQMNLCCQATLYNKINELEKAGRLQKNGMRNGTLSLT